jgi:uncharacterized integral membrane protein
MKKVKVCFWLLILGLIALVVFQNSGYFLDTQQALRLNLKVFPEYQSPSLPLVAFHLLFFLFGLLVAYLFGTPQRIRRRKTITRLTAEGSAQQKEMESMRAELARLRGEPLPGAVEVLTETSVTSPVKKS